jgi:hypothetical protein
VIRTAIVAAVTVLIFSAVAALHYLETPVHAQQSTSDGTTPTPTPGTSGVTGSATPEATAPAGSTQLAVDAITTGNGATSIGTIDECATVNVGETFQVDIVIKGVQNLLAWQAPITFDSTILQIEDRNVKLFLAASSGSQVLDASQQTPNDTGDYQAAAVDTSDPPSSPASGDGVLVRLTMLAKASGTSKVSIKPVDLNGDGVPDQGILLRNKDAAVIGDTNGDTIFDGPVADAEIHVGGQCPNGGGQVAQTSPSPSAVPSGTSNGSSHTWLWIVVGAVITAAVIATGGLGALAMRRRRSPPAPPAPPPPTP